MYKNFYVLSCLSKNQKSSFVSFVKTFTKKNCKFSCDQICLKILEELEYYFNINQSRYDFIKNFIDDSLLKKDIYNVVNETLKQIAYKEKQKPYYDKQKILQKKFRLKATEWRQSKEKPTNKQLFYYLSLCKKKGVLPQDLSEKSKLDLKNMISSLIEEKEKK